jgi:hypothetical protein
MAYDLFRAGRHSNLLPYIVTFDAEANVSTICDRLFRPIICAPGKWPRCKMELATVADGPPLYGAKPVTAFYGEFAQPNYDPVVRRRIRTLVNEYAVLRAELRRRAAAIDAADDPPPAKARESADLIRHTFAEAAA